MTAKAKSLVRNENLLEMSVKSARLLLFSAVCHAHRLYLTSAKSFNFKSHFLQLIKELITLRSGKFSNFHLTRYWSTFSLKISLKIFEKVHNIGRCSQRWYFVEFCPESYSRISRTVCPKKCALVSIPSAESNSSLLQEIAELTGNRIWNSFVKVKIVIKLYAGWIANVKSRRSVVDLVLHRAPPVHLSVERTPAACWRNILLIWSTMVICLMASVEFISSARHQRREFCLTKYWNLPHQASPLICAFLKKTLFSRTAMSHESSR